MAFQKNNSGFTLVEMMIVVGVLSVVIVGLIAIFVSAIQIQRYVASAYQLLDQSSYIMEYMTRAIRLAKKDVDGSCVGTAGGYYGSYESGIEFKNNRGQCVKFYLQSGRLEQNIEDVVSPLTSSNITVSKFNVSLSGQANVEQPKAVIDLKMQTNGLLPQPGIELQTTVSLRDLYIQ